MLDEKERLRLIELAKASKLFDDEGNKINMFHSSLRAPKSEVAPKSDIAQALELVAKAMSDIQQSTITTKEAQADAIIAALQQNQDVLAAVRDALAVTPVERNLEEWVFSFKKNKDGITGATAKQVK